MRRFSCPQCATVVYFDSTSCKQCGATLHYSPRDDEFVLNAPSCERRTTVDACNWSPTDGPYCDSCRLDTRRDDDPLREPFQQAKRRTLRQLYRHGVRPQYLAPALRFELDHGSEDHEVVIGHADGLITLDLAEADPVHLVKTRERLGEPYRTPLGHVRHEVGHWYWAAMADYVFTTEEFRNQFGDERADYTDALSAHYDQPDDGSWQNEYISHYAAAHPWEDFAESFAHVLHIEDTLETAADHHITAPMSSRDTFHDRYAKWVSLAATLNDLNRSMGTPDPYPFAVPPPAVDKLNLIWRSLAAPLNLVS